MSRDLHTDTQSFLVKNSKNLFSLSLHDKASQEYSGHLSDASTSVLSMIRGTCLIKLLMPFEILNGGCHHQENEQHFSESRFSALYLLFLVMYFLLKVNSVILLTA